MKTKFILLFAVSIFLLQNVTAQKHPWEEFGYKPRLKTLSNGKYMEFHDWDTIVHIGFVIFDRHNGKILGKVENDSIGGEERMKPYVVSRWISPDPLSEEYSSWSPYNYVAGNPIKYIDPDGREIWIYDAETKKSYVYTPNATEVSNTVTSTLDYLYNNGGETAQGVINGLVNQTDYSVSIDEVTQFGQSGATGWDREGTVSWNPLEGLVVGSGENQSPAIGLFHELDHANYQVQLQIAENGGDKESSKKLNDLYTLKGRDAEEERVRRNETDVANKTGNGVRNDYFDFKGVYKAENPTSKKQGTMTKSEQKSIEKFNKRAEKNWNKTHK